MANLKNITELPVAESAEGLNLIVNDNGAAKQIAASAVGAQADWNVTDEANPAFIKNKPTIPTKMSDLEEEWDLDLTVEATWNSETSASNAPVCTAAEGYSYDAFVAKIESGEIPKVKIRTSIAASATSTIYEFVKQPNIMTDTASDAYCCMWLGALNTSTETIILLPSDVILFQVIN